MAKLLLLLLAGFLSDFDDDVRYAAELRERGLYRIAELQCERLLEKGDLSDEQRVEATIEFSKTLAVQALNSRPPQRDEYWQRSFSIINKSLAQTTDTVQTILLRLQRALATLEMAEWSRREAEVQAASDADWNDARSQLRDAIRQLKDVESLLNQPRLRADQQEFTSTRLNELDRNTRYQLSRAYRNQAITYAGQPKDQIASLTQALNRLQSIAGETVADQLVWQSRMDRIECYRLRGDLDVANQLIKDAELAPDSFLGQLASAAIRLALASGQPQAALNLLKSQDGVQSHPELELARIETMVHLASEARNAAERTKYQREAAVVASQLMRLHGNYWGLRGEMLIARLADRSNDADDTQLLDTAAKTLLKQGSPEQASELFIRAARQAENDGQTDKAFDFRFKAATVDHQQGNLQAAIDQFRDVSFNRFPEHERAPEAHLLAVFDAAALYQQSARSEQREQAERSLSQYESLLKEHVQRWPTNPTADQARIWFGRLLTAKNKLEDAAANFQAVAANSEHAREAYSRLGEIYGRRLAKPSPEQVKQVRSWMAERLQIETKPEAQTELMLQNARVLLLPPSDYPAANRMIKSTISQMRPDSPGRELAHALTVIATAGTTPEAAGSTLSGVLPLQIDSLREILQRLQPIRDHSRDDTSLRELALEVVNLMRAYEQQFQPQDVLLIEQTIADTEQTPQAIIRYEKLARQQPLDRRIQLRYAELISQGRDRNSRMSALNQWRRVVQLSVPHSPEWFRGKLGVAQTYFDMGDRQKTRELIELLMTLYPDMGGPPLKKSFSDLLARCQP